MKGFQQIITIIPTRNSAPVLPRTLASLAAQTTRPDRVLVVDYGSTDRTAELAAASTAPVCEWLALPDGHSFFDACNRGLELVPQTRHLHILQPGDTLKPDYYQAMIAAMGAGNERALAFCGQRLLDDAGHRVSVSGRRRGRPSLLSREAFLARMARLTAQPLSTVLLRTGGVCVPAKLRGEISQLAHLGFFATYASQSERIARVNQPLCIRQWETPGAEPPLLPGMQPLVYDEIRIMQHADQLRGERSGWGNDQRRLWILAWRSALKALRASQMQKPYHAREIARAARKTVGWWRWLPAAMLIRLRDWMVFGLLRRRRHPYDLYR